VGNAAAKRRGGFVLLYFRMFLIRSTLPSRPNKVGLKRPPDARPSVHKSLFDFDEICYVGRRRRVMHDGMQYDPIRGQGQEPLKVGYSTIIIGYHLPLFIMRAGK